MKKDKIRIAVVGLGFGAEFVPIYLEHPDVESVTICDANTERLQSVAERFAIKKKLSDMGEVIQSEEIDAVHLISGIPEHAEQTLAVLKSGKHCACTVPMATSIVLNDTRHGIYFQEDSVIIKGVIQWELNEMTIESTIDNIQ